MDAGTWVIDPELTTVTIEIKNMGFMKVPATFKVLEGTIEVPESGEPRVRGAVAANSFHTGLSPRDKHVISNDFLKAGDYPEIVFTSSSTTRRGDDYVVAGTLQVAGSSAPMTLNVTDVSVDGQRTSFTGSGAIERAAVGVTKMPNFIIGPTVVVKVSGTATRGSAQ